MDHGEQLWLSLCLQEEGRWFFKRGVWERETEAEVLFAVEEMLGKPPSWPPCLTKLFFQKHLYIYIFLFSSMLGTDCF